VTTAAERWKARLADAVPADLGREIDIFDTQIELRRQGKLDEKVFAETRLRRGVYGQRYDNGQRHDGLRSQAIPYPEPQLTKGPNTLWDAPGMQRIKIPMGKLTAEQLDLLADLAEEYSDGILHITTRQDVQLHFVHVEDTVPMMRRLAAVGITTREACGNSVRNVTACPLSGVCHDESFDTTPYAQALAMFLLGHPDTQDFGRKFKIAFSGCKDAACGLASIHDVGLIARRRLEGAQELRGFEVVVGGGLGAVPQQAKLFDEFLPEQELLPLAQAICRVFARHGEKKNRARARLKFLVTRLGIDEFRRLVLEERAQLPADDRWTAFLAELHAGDDRPLRPAAPLADGPRAEGFEAWRRTNVYAQKQPGYAVATIKLPLGDFTAPQARAIADLARRFTGDTLRATVEQNLVLRWVSEADLPELHAGLRAVGLHAAGAGTLDDITACPGTDTCKLGISSSRGLASELLHQIGRRKQELPAEVAGLRIKTSGCFNSCGQHHIADIGFLGVSRNVRGRRVPHFQLVIGGEWTHNAGSYGLAIGAVPSKRVPEVVERLTQLYMRERQAGERFQDFFKRAGRAKTRELLQDLVEVPSYDEDPSFYSDWRDPREYTIGDMGVGECAGEVVSFTEFGLADSERELFEAQLQLDVGQPAQAARLAYRAMLGAARALLRMQRFDVPEEPDRVVAEFLARFHDTKLFHDPFVGPKFVHYLVHAHETAGRAADDDAGRRAIGEAQLFIEAAHACYERLTAAPAALAG
jgi:sulfite reductase (ferredoxin)